MFRYIAPFALLGLVACTEAKAPWESAPVTVATEQGPVSCQLYTPKAVLWDRALDRPASMGDDEANRHCRAEGEQRRKSPAAPAAADAQL